MFHTISDSQAEQRGQNLNVNASQQVMSSSPAPEHWIYTENSLLQFAIFAALLLNDRVSTTAIVVNINAVGAKWCFYSNLE